MALSAFATWKSGSVREEDLAAGKEYWGGKGFGLMQMCADKLPVPPGFTITANACRAFRKNPDKLMAALEQDLPTYLGWLQEQFGYMPLLSVRSGARVSMPGMMDTILNVGVTSTNVTEWAARIGEHCAADSRVRFNHMFKSTVGFAAPDDPAKQVRDCIAAVFNSWMSARAIEYRKLHNIPEDWGTAVNIQAMVFGNMGDDSGTGVAFTRDPSTGENKIVGEFLQNAQGEDVVAGIKTPVPLWEIRKLLGITKYNALVKLLQKLDAKYTDMQDVEFTFQKGELFLLQTRSGKRSAAAAFRIADELVEAGVINLATARKRVSFDQFVTAQRPALAEKPTIAKLGKPVTTGIAGSIGVVVGRVAFDMADIDKLGKDPVVLVRHETTPDDIAMMAKSAGIITAIGGFTSHAAVVARGMNIPCVTGTAGLTADGIAASINGKAIKAGDWLTLDGSTGRIWVGQGVVQQADTGYTIKFLQRLVADEGVRLRTTTPTSRAYNVAAETTDLVAWAKAAREVEDAVIDLRGLSAWMPPADAQFVGMIGGDNSSNLEAAVAALTEAKAKPNVSVLLPDGSPNKLFAQLQASGFDVIRAVDTLEEAVTTKGQISFSSKLRDLAGGDKGLEMLREMLEAKGANFATDDTGHSIIDAARKLLA